MYHVLGTHICLREIEERDADIVVLWRNGAAARATFFSTAVVTPDSHRLFVCNRAPHDLVWMIEGYSAQSELDGELYGMTALKVDVQYHNAEHGRTFIRPELRGLHHGIETEYTVLMYAFEVLQLRNVWLDVFAHNRTAIRLYEMAGFVGVGVDLPGHTQARGPVLWMTYGREQWAGGRQRFAELCGLELPEWQP